MGLKIRRLKGGFAYYAEYKLGRHCIYETIKAESAREAKRIYKARDKELRETIPQEMRSLRPTEARNRQVNAALSALLHKLVVKRVISEAEAIELLPEFSAPKISDTGSVASTVQTLRDEGQLALSEF